MLPPRIAFVAVVTCVTTTTTSLHAQLPPPPDDEVLVHLDGDKVFLEDLEDDTDWADEWTTLCESPCDKEVLLRHRYRVEGPGIRPSATFRLQGQAGDIVSVHVTAVSSTNYYIGVTTTIAGGTTALVGLVGLSVSAFIDSFTIFGEDRASRNTKTPWIATSAVGIGVLSAGLVIMLMNKRSHTSP